MKIKMTLTATRTYEINKEHYPEGIDSKGICASDEGSVIDDPFMFIDNADTLCVAKAEVIEE